jgi:CDP-glucose 4,6-dehydratase
MTLFAGAYAGKKVLVTGHTGFKGAWLCLWLARLGANVTGFALAPPTEPSAFEAMALGESMRDIRGDIRDLDALRRTFSQAEPDMVFHLAAQALVRGSYDDPKTTFDTNAGGTVNVLESLRSTPTVKAAVMITSDKCYRNQEWVFGYRENDPLGGEDPYSASKACAEMACAAYAASFFTGGGSCRIARARAGNVLGGGDWAKDRIVPDCVRAWMAGESPELRNPAATRPWQHVLEPLSGYLWLGAKLAADKQLHGEAFNFGPSSIVHTPAGDLADALLARWEAPAWRQGAQDILRPENTYLHLCCDKADHILGWRAFLGFEDTVRLTADWYEAASRGTDMRRASLMQIAEYEALAARSGLVWAGRQEGA